MKEEATQHAPLAERLRPQHWQDVIGQQHLLGEGKALQRAFASGKAHSMIFWGPPGVGKTTLARLSAAAFSCEWIALSAVLDGVKEIRAAVKLAQDHLSAHRRTLLFIDEIHRFNKAQQDALLPFTESGLLVFVGATTENPSFEVNNALLSRAQVYTLHALSAADLQVLLQRAMATLQPPWSLSDAAQETLCHYADGDARRLLNAMEQLANAFTDTQTLSGEQVNAFLASSARRFDKGGEYFYDQISALHKSVRGSAPDAALYWLCRMLDGGVDPQYLARRIIRMAWEDIGLADPRAMQIANDAAMTMDRLGSPEGELALAQAVIYLSVAAKSNAGYLAYNKARAWVAQDQSREVPLPLRNAPTRLMKSAGYGQGYRYAHDEPHGYAAGENYFPEGMPKTKWYQPVDRGLEQKIRSKLAFLQTLDQDASQGDN
ncbi:MAG: replication-associated recombination protein A [Legionellaceae bacterium]|nr:replication-associated recombination protein A [Legionellaceae bacterium]